MSINCSRLQAKRLDSSSGNITLLCRFWLLSFLEARGRFFASHWVDMCALMVEAINVDDYPQNLKGDGVGKGDEVYF
jgi:hypothetical protein